MSKTTSNGKAGGNLGGKRHSQGGTKAVIIDDGDRPVELETGEAIITREAVKKHWKKLSEINQDGGGVPIEKPQFKRGGQVLTTDLFWRYIEKGKKTYERSKAFYTKEEAIEWIKNKNVAHAILRDGVKNKIVYVYEGGYKQGGKISKFFKK